jgi:hypothetical protein
MPGSALQITGPMRILTIISSPSGLPALDVDAEWAAMTRELAGPVARNEIQVDRLPQPTMTALRAWLRTYEVNALHFIGHGEFDAGRGEGVLYLADEAGNPRAVDPSTLGPHLHDHDPLRLVVLNACQTARAADDDPFGGMAQGLVERGVPAVVAMQFPISDDAAVCFAGDFYASIACGQPVDQALSGTRRALLDSYGSQWATPVLFLRSTSGELFSVAATPVPVEATSPPPEPAPEPVPEPEPLDMTSLLTPVDVREYGRPGRNRHRGLKAVAAILVAGVVVVVGVLLLQGTPPTPAGTGTSAVIQNVYDVLASRGLADLHAQGFVHIHSYNVCSFSVAAGRIRQVILDNGASTETEVVGESKTLKTPLPLDTWLAVKISNGKPCPG